VCRNATDRRPRQCPGGVRQRSTAERMRELRLSFYFFFPFFFLFCLPLSLLYSLLSCRPPAATGAVLCEAGVDTGVQWLPRIDSMLVGTAAPDLECDARCPPTKDGRGHARGSSRPSWADGFETPWGMGLRGRANPPASIGSTEQRRRRARSGEEHRERRPRRAGTGSPWAHAWGMGGEHFPRQRCKPLGGRGGAKFGRIPQCVELAGTRLREEMKGARKRARVGRRNGKMGGEKVVCVSRGPGSTRGYRT